MCYRFVLIRFIKCIILSNTCEEAIAFNFIKKVPSQCRCRRIFVKCFASPRLVQSTRHHRRDGTRRRRDRAHRARAPYFSAVVLLYYREVPFRLSLALRSDAYSFIEFLKRSLMNVCAVGPRAARRFESRSPARSCVTRKRLVFPNVVI